LCIEKVILSGTVEDAICEEWCERKKKSGLKKPQQLFDEGKVLEAAKLGLPQPQGKVAHNYNLGDNGFDKDLDKCFEFATLAAKGGDEDGQFWLGCAYFYGEGAKTDFVAALKWFELAAEQGSFTSMSIIGHIFEDGGPGVAKDVDAAFTWFEKAAEGGNSAAQYKLATMYYDGIGVAKGLAAARIWFKKSSDQGNVDAQTQLGMMMAIGGAMELSKGVTLVKAAAEQGDSWRVLVQTGALEAIKELLVWMFF
jgi:TPR repeat protein